MNESTIEKFTRLIRGDETESLSEHVRNCSRCIVGGDGSAWYCREGAAIRQAKLKRRFYGDRRG